MIKQLVLKDMMMQRKLGFVYLICLVFLAIVDFRSDSFLMTISVSIPFLSTVQRKGFRGEKKR